MSRGAEQARLAAAQTLTVALAGNPNVGKSTVFNALTGLHQHTGNWPGKTVSGARGIAQWAGRRCELVDLPGTYSLLAHSAEEEVARDFLCFGAPDCTVIVADATCLERNLNLVLQTTEITEKVVVCVNLMDEAERKGIVLDLTALSAQLGVPVVSCAAREGRGLEELLRAATAVADGKRLCAPPPVRYPAAIAQAAATIEAALPQTLRTRRRWLSLRLLEGDEGLDASLCRELGTEKPRELAAQARADLAAQGVSTDALRDRIAASLVLRAEEIACEVVRAPPTAGARDRKLDRILTSKRTGIPIMLLLLAGVFFLTIVGANYPSALLSRLFFSWQAPLAGGLTYLGAPAWLVSTLVDGVWRTLAWVVSVMLPPMAIFFPLFTLLEDFGYLPRVAFNLDHAFSKAHACGKQSLTMCMGFIILHQILHVIFRVFPFRSMRFMTELTNNRFVSSGEE